MVKIIAEVIKEKEPNRKIKVPQKEFSKFIALIGARFSTLYSNIFNQPNLLSVEAVIAGCLPSFYSSKKAMEKIGYRPQRSFREAVSEMFDYYKEKGLLNRKERYVDRR